MVIFKDLFSISHTQLGTVTQIIIVNDSLDFNKILIITTVLLCGIVHIEIKVKHSMNFTQLQFKRTLCISFHTYMYCHSFMIEKTSELYCSKLNECK